MKFGRYISSAFHRAALGLLCLAAGAGTCLGADEMGVNATHASSPIRQGSWALMQGKVTNRSDNVVNGALVVADKYTEDVQFSAPVWSPAHTIRSMPLPFLSTTTRNKFDVNLVVRLMDNSGGSGQVLAKDVQQVLFSDGTDFPSAVYQTSNVDGPSNVLSRLRVFDRRKPRVSYFDQRKIPFPSNVLGLLCFSELLIATGDSLTPAQAMAVREWVVQGGRLWIMADRVPPETIRMILGDEWKCEVAGETELSHVAVESGRRGETFPAVSFEEPIHMVRLVNDGIGGGMEVTETIEKWPAILWRPVGSGTVLVTTFDLAGMGVGDATSNYGWFNDITDRFFSPGKALPPAAVGGQSSVDVMHELASTIAGHEVVRREPVATILGGMCGVLLLLGWHFGRKRRLELLAPAAVGLSLVATVAMLLLGAKSKGNTPLTLSSMSEARVSTLAERVGYSGAADVYSPSAFDGSLSVPTGSWIMPDMSSQAGHIVRMNWSELETMRWDYLHFRAATLRSAVAGTMTLKEPLEVRGTFGAEGFIGELTGSGLLGGKDTILAAPGGNLAPRLDEAGHFTAGVAEQMAPGDLAGPGTISPERAHRLAAMKATIPEGSRTSTTLYTWSQKLDAGVEVHGDGGETPERQILTLAAAPVTITQPARGVTFTVPAAFMRLANFRLAKQATALYDDRYQRFPGTVAGGKTTLVRFALPEQVLPMQIDKAVLKLNVTAPNMKMRVFTLKPGGKGPKDYQDLMPVAEGPMGPKTVEIAGGPEIQLDADGGIVVGLDVSGNETGTWEWTDMSLSVTGHIVARPSETTGVGH